MKHHGSPIARISQLDGLRGLAALAVVISHSANAGLLPGVLGRGFGQMGVALFYALSAFLLGHLYFRTDCTPATLKRYTISRLSRVLPLFYTVLGTAACVFLLLGQGVYQIDSLSDILLNAALIQGTSVLWSIPVELQYYLVFALLWWLHACHGVALGGVIALALGLQITAALALSTYFPDLGVYNLAHWGHLFLCGLVLSQMTHSKLSARAAPLQALCLLAIAVLAMPQIRRSFGLPTFENYIDPLTAGVPILILYLTLRQAAPLRFLEHKLLRWLGNLSFGLYLIHMPIITLVKQAQLDTLPRGVGFSIVLLCSLFLASLARRWIEVPAQQRLKHILTAPPAASQQSG